PLPETESSLQASYGDAAPLGMKVGTGPRTLGQVRPPFQGTVCRFFAWKMVSLRGKRFRCVGNGFVCVGVCVCTHAKNPRLPILSGPAGRGGRPSKPALKMFLALVAEPGITNQGSDLQRKPMFESVATRVQGRRPRVPVPTAGPVRKGG